MSSSPAGSDVRSATRSRGVHERLKRDTTPLGRKAGALGLFGLVAGLTGATLDYALGAPLWVMAATAVGAGLAVLWLAEAWVAAPLVALRRVLGGIQRDDARLPLSVLPVSRTDDLGEIARTVHFFATERIKHDREARALRRTLDERVQQATARATAELQRLASRDGLTGVGNRRFLDEQLPRFAEAALASNTELVCVAIDMDRFKQVNDTLGHATGDDMLKLAADLLRACVREEDVVVRYGGDEFFVLMPGGTVERGVDLADSVRRLFRQQAAQRIANPTCRPDLSAGVAGLFYDHAKDGDALLNAADARLFEAKRAGRGRTAA
jgi:diguanylate cyclase (GGDEF)-like protein